jgi:signal transduction histidine kinase
MNPKRKFRNFLLDKRFQLKYTLAVVLVSSAISAGLGYFLYQAHRESSEVAAIGAIGDHELGKAFAAELKSEDKKVLIYLGLFLGGLVLSLGILGIMATHRIAGPAYAMRRNLSLIADGQLPKIRKLRRGDELTAVSQELIRMTQYLRTREEDEYNKLKEIISNIDQSVDIQACKADIETIVSQKAERLNLESQ